MHKAILVAIAASACAAASVSAVVIDHTNVDAVASLPQATLDAIGRQTWLFTHASVGGNMVGGMNDLHSTDPARYQLGVSAVAYNSSTQRANNPPSPTVAGRVYECQRGNPGWQSKFTIFDNSVRLGGWHDSAVSVVMDKLCYIDQVASASSYINLMASLEAAYPNTVFVYATMPLMTETGSENVARNQYNAAVRAYCVANHRLLFDIADIEAHTPAGIEQTFTSGGQVYQRLYADYSSDGGHLNSTGSRRVATGWYTVAAFIAVRNAPCDFNGDGCVNHADFDLFRACASGPGISRDNTTTCQAADLDRDQDVDQSDFGTFQKCVSGNLPANPTCDD